MMRIKWSGKVFRKRMAFLMIVVFWGCQLLSSGPALALPTGGVVTSGTASIVQAGNTTNINQSTNKASINWQSFSIAPAETVNFNQPSIYSITLNRVVGNESSIIAGALNATGRVFLINSNGILFTRGSSVNTSGFLASTLNITDADFNAGNYVFNANGSLGSIVSQGTITASNGGYVALLGNTVSNQGVISATKGTVALASGDQITLNFNGNSLLNVTIDEGTLNALVENKQAIYADGGTVILTAKAADDLLTAQVNNTGIIQARTIDDLKGNIELLALGGTVNLSGTLDASAPNGGDGGLIETSGNKVTIADSAVITTKSAYGNNGTWVIDPDGFTIGLGADMTGTALSNALAGGNVTIASTSGSGTDGNINVNDAVSWSANTLTLNATNNIYVNNVMTATGTASFAANYGYVLNNGVPTTTPSGAGNADGTPYGLYMSQGVFNPNSWNSAFAGQIVFSGTGTVTLNGTRYTVINDLNGLEAVNSNLAGNYVLGADIGNATYFGTFVFWNPMSVSASIGSTAAPFTGNFNGFGHVIQVPETSGTGLFGAVGTGATVSNLGIVDPQISPEGNAIPAVGMFANTNQGSIINSFVSSLDYGATLYNSNITYAGGLVGDNAGLIAQTYVYGAVVYATHVAGGLVGINEASGKIIDSSARSDANWTGYIQNTGGATGITYVGGLVGINNGEIERSYSNIQLQLFDLTSTAGGFVGQNTGTIDQCYAYMSGTNQAANLAGFVYDNAATGSITNSYTTALYTTDPSSQWNAGFAYTNEGTIINAYATEYSGNTANAARYGFVESNTGTITDAYWYAATGAGATPVTDGSGSTATQLPDATTAAALSSYTGFDSAIWGQGQAGFPVLRNIMVNLYTDNSNIPTYGAATTLSGLNLLPGWGLQGGGGIGQVDSTFTVVTDNGYVDAGTQAASAVLSSSVYTNIKGLVMVNPAPLTATVTGISVADKVYDGTTTATLSSGATATVTGGLVGGQTLSISYTGAAFSDKNAGTDKTVFLDYSTTGTAKASNYALPADATMTTASITPKTITATVAADNKTYDGTTTDTVTYQLPGKVTGDNLSLAYSAAFADPNAGQGKAVTVSGISLTGSDAANYTLTNASTLQTTATINPIVLMLYGTKASNDSNTAVPASSISATNLLVGDTVTLGGSATIAGTTPGAQPITSVSGLTVNNPNYTVTGATGTVVVGPQSLALDHVASGTANISTSGTTTTITTSTNNTIIDWWRFMIAANETVKFVEPSATSIVLNRVTGGEQSVISGILTSNGRVFLLNSNGVLFTAGSYVNPTGFLASALQMTDANFIAGNYVLTNNLNTGSVVNNGTITVADGGFITLASNQGVTNSGTLSAPDGKVLLAGANNLTLNLDSADSGLASYVIAGLAGTTTIGGAVNVAGSTTSGGLIETAGTAITLGNSYQVSTGTNGTWSFTMPTITIGSSGNVAASFVGNNLALRNLTLNALTGNITFNDAVAWSGNYLLTLNAANNININNAITATGTNAGLVMNYGGDYNILTKASYSGAVIGPNGYPVAQKDPHDPANGGDGIYGSITLSGSNTSLTMNGQPYTLIHDIGTYATTGTLSGYYALAQNLDATAWSAANTGTPSVFANFSGTLAGLGHTIGNLTLNAPSSYYVGLIGQTSGSTNNIRDIGLTNVNITGSNFVGPLIGRASNTTVSQAYVEQGSVTGALQVGGLLGGAWSSTIESSYADVSITGVEPNFPPTANIGGLIGYLVSSTVVNSHASAVIGSSYNLQAVGGLIGYSSSGTTVTNSYATGNVTGYNEVGGLIGYLVPATGDSVTNSFATGNVTGATEVGGLIGFAGNQGNPAVTVQNCYATGNVTSTWNIDDPNNGAYSQGQGLGGLIGYGYDVNISHSFATGNVTLLTTDPSVLFTGIGGLIGYNGGGSVTGSYATGTVNGGNLSGSTGWEGSYCVGGLVGDGGTITNSYATGNVTGHQNVGGLAGSAVNVTNSYATGNVNAYEYVGGLVGTGSAGSSPTAGNIANSWSSGNVSGTVQVGGLAGCLSNINVTNSYATGNVTGVDQVGGFAGMLGQNTNISDSWQSGTVTGSTNTGGFVGVVVYNNNTLTNDYWNSDSQTNAIGGFHSNSAYTPAEANVTNSQGLASWQWAYLPYYMNGTADQVIAYQTAAQETQGQSTYSGQTSYTKGDESQQQVNAFTPVNTGGYGASIDGHIVYADSDSYSAYIKAIEADGVKYDLEDTGAGK